MYYSFIYLGDLKNYLLSRRHLVADKNIVNDDDSEVSCKTLTGMVKCVASALDYLSGLDYVHR